MIERMLGWSQRWLEWAGDVSCQLPLNAHIQLESSWRELHRWCRGPQKAAHSEHPAGRCVERTRIPSYLIDQGALAGSCAGRRQCQALLALVSVFLFFLALHTDAVRPLQG